MDYEELYRQMLVYEKDLKDKLAGALKTYKSLIRDSEKGELKNLSRELALLRAHIGDFENIIAGYAGLIEGFDVKEYMENGDFAMQMTLFCEQMSVDIKGEYPSYEIFPYKVRIESETQELFVDRKKTQSVRPRYFVESIKKSQDKLNKAAFNVTAFLGELADAYDLALLRKEKSEKAGKNIKRQYDILLKDLYTILTPMQRFRKDYDMQSYAFDLARLYNSDINETRDGRMFEFGSSRNASKLIRILDKDNREQFLGTIRFYSC